MNLNEDKKKNTAPRKNVIKSNTTQIKKEALNDTENIEDEYLIYMKTAQSMQFKLLLDVLKDLLTEVNLLFDENGIKLISLDPGRLGMIHLVINRVDYYHCEKEMYIGVYVHYMYKILRSLTNSHHMEWRVRKDNPTMLEINLVNSEKRTATLHTVKILDLDIEEITIPQTSFDCVISMPSNDLQKYIRELGNVSNIVTIRGHGKSIELSSNGDLGGTTIIINPTPSGMNWLHKDLETEFFKGTYFCKYLEKFCRTSVDNTVEIFFKQDYPLILRYEMCIGSIRFCVAPIKMDSNLNTSAEEEKGETTKKRKQRKKKTIESKTSEEVWDNPKETKRETFLKSSSTYNDEKETESDDLDLDMDGDINDINDINEDMDEDLDIEDEDNF
jgi:proliferating cell nuclear antigen